MKLKEAIEIMTNYNYSLLGIASQEILDAQKLSIEALKVLDGLEPMFRVEPFGLLPGETEE